MKNKAIVFSEHGKPDEVLRLVESGLSGPTTGEVGLRMLAASINPSDLGIIGGTYGTLPPLPAVAGLEGIAEIVEIGKEVSNLGLGDRVRIPHGIGAWQTHLLSPAKGLVKIPRGIPTEQAATAFVNPPTALLLLQEVTNLEPGDWVIQNAANSGVGRAVIQIAKSKQLKTVSIVRRPERVEELKALGADVVVVHNEHMNREIREQTGGAKLRLGLNGTGGHILSDMVKQLSPGGTVVTYGAMARKPFMLSNAQLIFRDIRACGFWITAWYRNAKGTDIQEMFLDLSGLMKSGKIHVPVEQVYPMREIQAAIEHADREGRSGKILLGIG